MNPCTPRNAVISTPHPSSPIMHKIFKLCRDGEWDTVLREVMHNPGLAVTPIVMDNHITTTVLHQAITSKGDMEARARVIRHILRETPRAAAVKNGYGSLPIHVIAQRNTKLKAKLKEDLIFEFVKAYKDGLVEEGGTGRRTPLHIVFTGKHGRPFPPHDSLCIPHNSLTSLISIIALDYVSARLTKVMIQQGRNACFIRDKKGWLPAHVACSRHCSPEKLRMLLEANPDSLYAKGGVGETILDLAKATATKSHPNYALIEEIQKHMEIPSSHRSLARTGPFRSLGTLSRGHWSAPPLNRHTGFEYPTPILPTSVASTEVASTPGMISEESDASTRGRLDSSDSGKTWEDNGWGAKGDESPLKKPSPKGKAESAEALLLLARHRNDGPDSSYDDEPMEIARV